MRPSRLALAHLPTPVWHSPALDALVGTEVWVKRDDMTAGAEAGNKVRKLEFLLADAREQGADTVITCGAAQSNHARATALLARQSGMDSSLFLRVGSPADEESKGNLLLDRLAGSSVHFISETDYERRAELMAEAAQQHGRLGRKAVVIPEGGSSPLGTFGYIHAMHELKEQSLLGLIPKHFDSVVMACGSGGTAAGVALGLAETGLADRAEAIAVCDDAAYFEQICAKLCAGARRLCPELPAPAPLLVHDEFKGPAYGTMDEQQARFLRAVSTKTGLVLDPVYSGKALYGLSCLRAQPGRALFIHTGGLPGLLAHSQF